MREGVKLSAQIHGAVRKLAEDIEEVKNMLGQYEGMKEQRREFRKARLWARAGEVSPEIGEAVAKLYQQAAGMDSQEALRSKDFLRETTGVIGAVKRLAKTNAEVRELLDEYSRMKSAERRFRKEQLWPTAPWSLTLCVGWAILPALLSAQ